MRYLSDALLVLGLSVPSLLAKDSLDDSWSATVNGIQARIVLKESRIVNKTPIISTYVTLRNVSDVANPMKIN